MVEAIASNEPIRAEPSPKGGGAVISARFPLTPAVTLTDSEILRAASRVIPQMRRVIGVTMFKRYKASGLRVRSGALKRDVMINFVLQILVRGRSIVLDVEWFPQTRYFFAQLFGAVITPRVAKALRFKIGNRVIFAQKVTLKPRNFIKFETELRRLIQKLMDDALSAAMDAKAAGLPILPAPPAAAIPPVIPPAAPIRPAAAPVVVGVVPPVRPTRAIEVVRKTLIKERRTEPVARAFVSPSGRITEFRIRKPLRRPSGPLFPEEARLLARQLFQIGITGTLISQLVGLKRPQLVGVARAFQVFLT